ncbi:MAG: peptidoglycan editing factor PgeF [Bacillota bacterium]
MFKWKSIDNFKYLEINSFKDNGCNAYFTSKKGGVSKGVYKSLNLGLHTEDDKENVLKNRKITAKNLNLKFSSLTSAEQIHGNEIHIVNENDKGKGRKNYNNAIKNTDALITKADDITLFSYYADCVPLYFYDKENKLIGLAHSGWKGTLKKIAVKVIRKMKIEFNSENENCLIAIGPAISKDYYEVDKKIINKFKNEFSYIDEVTVYKGKGRYLLDLPKLNKIMLIKEGIMAENITESKMCTYSDKENFYSYRRDQGKTGRMASIITF